MERTPSASGTNFSVFIGLDISKSWFDAVIWIPDQPLLLHRQFKNTPQGFAQLWRWLKKHISASSNQWLVCMEATGMYTRRLVHYLLAKSTSVWVASALDIKRSLGLHRGKSDKIDAHRIANYAAKNHLEARLVSIAQTSLEKLQDLESNRRRLIKAKQILQRPISELKHIDPKSAATLQKANRKALKGIEQSIAQIEALIEQALKQDPELNRKFELATSVSGVGKVLGLQLLLATHGFTRMMDGRKLACHAGVAPFKFESGTSTQARNRVSRLANLTLKKTLHMAALSAAYRDPEFIAYFQRKIQQGKNKMSVLNAIRNKIIHRVIAVLRRGYPYINFSTQNA